MGFLDVRSTERPDRGAGQDHGRTAGHASLLFYLAVKPSIAAGSRQLATRLAGSQKENRSSCPVCGSMPIIGELDAEGSQWLHCGFCWHRWPVKRLACPFCSNRDSASLEYLYSDDEPEYRVNLCGGCRRYLKVVDTRKIERRLLPAPGAGGVPSPGFDGRRKGLLPCRGVNTILTRHIRHFLALQRRQN
jgi:hypothetical protein